MSKRRGPPIRHSLGDHQLILDQVALCMQKHPSWAMTTALTALGIAPSRYQYAKERLEIARLRGEVVPPTAPEALDHPKLREGPVQAEAYTPTRCQECKTARARSMWNNRAVCQGCYEEIKHRASMPKQPEELEVNRSSRVIPKLTNPAAEEAADEQESEEASEDEDGILDGMEIEFEDDSDGEEKAASDSTGQELVRVFVIEGTIDAVVAILERRFG